MRQEETPHLVQPVRSDSDEAGTLEHGLQHELERETMQRSYKALEEKMQMQQQIKDLQRSISDVRSHGLLSVPFGAAPPLPTQTHSLNNENVV